MLSDHQTRLDFKEKIKEELRKADKKENYLTEEERLLISNFLGCGIIGILTRLLIFL